MAKYLFRGNYVGDGVAGLMRDGGTKRLAAAEAAMQSLGITLESMYYAFGDTDLFGIADCPDDATAVASSLMINSSGAVSISMTRLMTPAEMDAACEKTGSYTPPGG